MMESPVEQVRGGVDIVDLISQHVSLKKAGRTFKGLCPFHSEKTPSFVVFPDTGRWHCFGCGEGGDVFTFLMKVENLTFAEALRRLADRIGLVIAPRTHETDERREANLRLYAANEAAAVYYHSLLLNSASARQYVASRGIQDPTIQEFLLGLATPSFDAMQRQLQHQGFTNDELLAAGLLYQPDNGPLRDRYHGRLMFPIRDAEGLVVSFGARGLTPDATPKYLNGPQTELFDKGSTLFGLFQGANVIKREQRAVVVEGYVDVVIAHQAGFQNVVATLGTAVTERHLRQLARLAPEICMALDPDAAGQHAATRSMDIARTALAASVPVLDSRGRVRTASALRAVIKIAALPDGKDPDELILRDPAEWRAAIASARPVIDHALHELAQRHDLTSARGKHDASDAVVPLLLDIPDPIEQAHYVELAAQQLGLPDSMAIRQELRAAGAVREAERRRPHPAPNQTGPRPLAAAPAPIELGLPSRQQPRRPTDQDYAIALAAAAAKRGLARAELVPGDFTESSCRALALRLMELQQTSAKSDWRPDLLDLADDTWLAEPVERARSFSGEIERYSDSQLTISLQAIARQLHRSRLGHEQQELAIELARADNESVEQIKGWISAINREIVALAHVDNEQPKGPSAVGRRVSLMPSRFRALPNDSRS